jgi:PAS domain S-box-containing protein
MANTAPVLLWIAGPDGLCTFFNDPWLAFTGRTMEQEIGSGWAEGIHHEDFQSTMTGYLEAFVEHRSFRLVYRLRRADGEYRWILDTGVPRFSPDGSFAGYIGSCVDVTEQKNAEDTLKHREVELQRQKELYETLCNVQSDLGDAVVLFDLDQRRVLYVNEAFEKLIGYTPTEFTMKVESDPLSLCPSEDVPALRERFSRLDTPVPPNCELRFIHKAGHVVELEILSKFVSMAEQLVSISIIRDVTKQNEADRALRRNEAKLRAIIEAAGDGILTLDNLGLVESANPAAERLFGYRRGELIGMMAERLVPELATGQPLDLSHVDEGVAHETIGRTRAGVVFRIEVVLSEAGEPRVTTAIVRDISERQLLERQLHQANEELQRRLGQDLHDGIGQVLTAIAFMAKDVAGELPPACATKGGRLVEVVNDAIVQVRRLARGLTPIDVSGRSAPSVLQDLADTCHAAFGVPCSFEHEDWASDVESAVTTQLYLIAQEAISNAVKHGKATSVKMSLRANGERRTLSVIDDGIGISNTARTPGNGGLGLKSMLYRARVIGGTLRTQGLEPSGTAIECAWWQGERRG